MDKKDPAYNRSSVPNRSDTSPLPRPIRGSYWIVDDQLLAGGYPCSFNSEGTRRRLEGMLNAGIRSFIDLTFENQGLELYESALKQLAEDRTTP